MARAAFALLRLAGRIVVVPSPETAPVVMLVIGAICGWLYERTLKGKSFEEVGKRMGVLMASGLIVGESLFGVLNAGVIGSTENEAPFAVFGIAETWPEGGGMLSGIIVFGLIVFALYNWIRGQSAKV